MLDRRPQACTTGLVRVDHFGLFSTLRAASAGKDGRAGAIFRGK